MEQEVALGQPRTGPLTGVRVADFSAIFSGPIAGAMLADQGADVIKVEAFTGDLMRKGYPQSGGMASALLGGHHLEKHGERHFLTHVECTATFCSVQAEDGGISQQPKLSCFMYLLN